MYNCKGVKVSFNNACYCNRHGKGLESIIRSDSVSMWALCPENVDRKKRGSDSFENRHIASHVGTQKARKKK